MLQSDLDLFDEIQDDKNQSKLSYLLENSLYLEILKDCNQCGQQLIEEEMLTGMLKNQSEYIIKCPKCKQCFVPKFMIYTEHKSKVLPEGKKG